MTIKAGNLGRHVVGNGESAAAGASDAELEGVVGVAFLLDDGVIVHQFFAPIVRNLVEVDRDESA